MSSLSAVRCLLTALAFWIVPAIAFADSVTLAWDPSDGATGYTVRWGTSQGVYPNSADAGNNTTAIISGLTAGATYWAVAEAYNSEGVSPYSVPLQFTVAGPAPLPCTYPIAPASATAPAAGTSGTITVNTQVGCAWAATSGNSALVFQNGTGRSGPGSVTFTVAANTATTARTVTGTVAGQTFTVSQVAAASCTYSINPTAINVFGPAASGTILVTTQAGCAWSASSASSFLTFQNGTGRTGSGSLTFAVTANTGTIARTGAGTVAGQGFSVSQAAPAQACTYAISPGFASAPAGGLSGTIAVTTQPACAWTAGTTSTFITFPDGSGRSGSGTVSYVVAPNASGFRSASATVAGKPFSLSQTGTTCAYSVSPANISRSAAASTGTVTVSTPAGCAWSATSTTGFLTFQNGTGRTGSGAVAFSITENSDAGERNGVGTVAGVTVTVAQAGTSSTPTPPLKWSSDFDGDGKNDILVQDSVLGVVEAWFLDNGIVKGTRILDSLDTNWTLAGRGDFNGDNKPDLVWQHKTDGTVTLWYMDGTTRIGSANVSMGQGEPQWRIVGVGDFNADQHPDLVWQNDSTGSLSAWLMNGSAVFGTASLVPDKATDVRWKVAGVADVNMDGKPDLLWRHLGTGEVVAWLMNGLSVTIQAPLSPSVVADQRWQVGAVTDVNGDGKPDIVWHHTDGTIMFWHMNGTSRVTFPVLPVGLPAGWIVVGPK